ncbi:aminoglycoside phosphotransferase family protein [Nocardia sp. BMG51109]|uniref:aminoglycoside phosphotransferase family protein n=1 Tax=Nocardia sp. BMG51109 TaxID=1056816 RepID=UPI0004B30706|nr:aminoglycoside phosphotransferase family protein [Nocardia sp. BMG51109]
MDRVERACRPYRRLRREPVDIPDGFPALPEAAALVADWTVRFTDPEPELAQVVPAALLERAAAWRRAPAVPAGPLPIVNRDTPLGNIPAAEREPWLLIDHQPYLGEATFDAGFPVMIQTQCAATPEQARRVVRHTARPLAVGPERARGRAFLRSIEEIGWAIEDDEPGLIRLHLAVAHTLGE